MGHEHVKLVGRCAFSEVAVQIDLSVEGGTVAIQISLLLDGGLLIFD